jgi:hypothetical protein
VNKVFFFIYSLSVKSKAMSKTDIKVILIRNRIEIFDRVLHVGMNVSFTQ